MSQVRVGQDAVTSGEIDRGLSGAWVAELEIDTATPPAMGAAVDIVLGALVTFSGTVLSSGAKDGRARLFVVGGAGGLVRTIDAQHYANGPTALELVQDVLREAGERLSGSVDVVALGSLTVPTWQRAEGVAAVRLGQVARYFGLTWRVLADGSTWVGSETWPAHAGEAPLELHRDDAHGFALVADGETVAPGETVGGRKVYRAVQVVSPETLRARLTYERSASGDFELAVRAMLPELPYLATYEARVVAQNADGSLEVIAYDPAIGGLSRVPIRLGIPGATVKVLSGARVDIGFEGGSPAKAYAGLWNTDAAMTELRIVVDGAQSPAAVARRGDGVSTGVLTVALTPFPPPPAPPTAQLFSLVYVDAEGSPVTTIFSMLLDVATVQVLPAPGVPVPFAQLGQIIDGSAGVYSG